MAAMIMVVWSDDYGRDIRKINVHIQKLRKKLFWASMVKNIYEIGCRLKVSL